MHSSPNRKFRLIRSLLLSLLIICAADTVSAQNFETTAPQAILVDFATGEVLYEKNADFKSAPSSMTKTLTAYILFDTLKKGDYTLEDEFYVSPNARSMEGSRMFIEQGSKVKLEDLVKGIIIQSGNDATTCVAEGISGTEDAFSDVMNIYAKKLGMINSSFKNSNGLPHADHYSTVRDLATLARAVINDFPEYYHYFSEKEFTYNKITQYNRDKLLYKPNLGADGLKTGFTDAGGYGMISSAVQKGRRLISVINGTKSPRERVNEAEKLLWYGFNNYTNVRLYERFDVIDSIKVWGGTVDSVPVVTTEPIDILVKKNDRLTAKFKLEIQYKEPWDAPIKQGTHIANLVIYKNDTPLIQKKLYAANDVEEAGIFQKIMQKVSYLVNKF